MVTINGQHFDLVESIYIENAIEKSFRQAYRSYRYFKRENKDKEYR